MEPLPTVKQRFCKYHSDLDSQCCVVTCTRPAEGGFRTCTNESHRKLETWVNQENKAIFQLKRRLARLGPGSLQPENSLSLTTEGDRDAGHLGSSELADDVLEVDEDGICEGKDDGGNEKPKARFGRRRTHNEELCVASCGVILGRATFYGSEAPNGVRVSPQMPLDDCHILNVFVAIPHEAFSNKEVVTSSHLARQQLQNSGDAA
jgi:hypothetical protein